jgi:hypothetical protein
MHAEGVVAVGKQQQDRTDVFVRLSWTLRGRSHGDECAMKSAAKISASNSGVEEPLFTAAVGPHRRKHGSRSHRGRRVARHPAGFPPKVPAKAPPKDRTEMLSSRSTAPAPPVAAHRRWRFEGGARPIRSSRPGQPRRARFPRSARSCENCAPPIRCRRSRSPISSEIPADDYSRRWRRT